MPCIVANNEVSLSGPVGIRDWLEDGFLYEDVAAALAQIGRANAVKIRLNSAGGLAWVGSAIHALLSSHRGRVDITVDGIAGSAASVIAMAGRLTMSSGALLMIHRTATTAWGDAGEIEKAVAQLRACDRAYAEIYAGKSGKSIDEIDALMAAETWMTGEEAVAAGFADRAASVANDNAPAPSAFPYAAFARAPARLVAMAAEKGWSVDSFKAALAAPHARKEIPMSDTKTVGQQPAIPTAAVPAAAPAAPPAPAVAAPVDLDAVRAEAVAADRARRAAIMALPEASGREALAEHLWATGQSVEAAKATLAVAGPAASSAESDAEAYARTRVASASALASPAPNAAASRNASVEAIVAAANSQIKRR